MEYKVLLDDEREVVYLFVLGYSQPIQISYVDITDETPIKYYLNILQPQLHLQR